MVAGMEYECEGVLRSEGKREYLVLGSQELLENSREKERWRGKRTISGIGPRITDDLRSKKQEVVLFLISTA